MSGRRSGLFGPFFLAVICAVIVAVAGTQMSEPSGWYYSLHMPPWKLPDWIFGVIWTAIYCLLVVAALVAWRNSWSSESRKSMLWRFAINAVLGVLWSFLFFREHRPDWALLEGAVFWLSVVALMTAVGRNSRGAGWLLLPYLAWVTYAAVLNWVVVALNGPFQGV